MGKKGRAMEREMPSTVNSLTVLFIQYVQLTINFGFFSYSNGFFPSLLF